MASTGAVIHGNATVQTALMSFARSIIYTTAPSFPMVAVIRAGYNLLSTGGTQKSQEKIQNLVRHFFKVIISSLVWDQATNMGILSILVSEDWESQEFLAHCLLV